MVRLKGPLMSMTAQKQLGKTLIYKMKNGRAFVTSYGRPGSKNPFSRSASQTTNREFYAEAVGVWQAMSQEEKDVYNDYVKSQNLKMSGWNYFYQFVFNNPSELLGDSFYGTRIYGDYLYGKT